MNKFFHSSLFVCGYILLLCSMILSSCRSIGPGLLPTNRKDYNSSLQESDKQQLLLNLVRMQYADDPYFLGVSSVSAQMELDKTISAQGEYQNTSGALAAITKMGTINPSVAYFDRPTITYAPLQGQDFTRLLMTPMSINNIYLLLQSGWSIARVLRVTTQGLGDLPNAIVAARPGSSHIPKYKQFVELVHYIRDLQLERVLTISGEQHHNSLDIKIVVNRSKKNTAKIAKLFKLLNKPNSGSVIILTQSKELLGQENVFAIQTRSVLSMMYYLSKSVDVPDSEKRSGVVMFPKLANGKFFDWHDVTRGMLKIYRSKSYPQNKAVAIYYRNSWFYIKDNDVNSKETMSLMTLVFALQAGDVKGQVPVLTLPL